MKTQVQLSFKLASEALQHGGKTQGAQLLQRILDKYNDNLPPEIDAFALLRCTARLLISAVSEPSTVDEELLSRLCGIYKSAALSTRKYHNGQGQDSQCLLQECKWFEKTGYNTAVQNLKSWPVRYLIDLLHYSCHIQYPVNAPQGAHREKLIHDINSNYIQAILYTAQARSVSPLSTKEDLPKTSYSGKPPPCSLADIKLTLYRNVFNRYTQVDRLVNTFHESSASIPATEGVVESIRRKQLVLAPLAFEALLFMQCSNTRDGTEQGSSMVDELSFKHIFDQTMALSPPQKTYSIFADMILAAGTGNHSTSSDPGLLGPPMLPVSTTVNLLIKLITGLKTHPSYDAAQATKWMRCMVQVVLDQLDMGATVEAGKGPSPDSADVATVDLTISETHCMKNLGILAMLTDHALLFARSFDTYPAEELQWLATTLFNLAIDIYVASPSSSSSLSASASGSAPRFQGGTARSETGEHGGTESEGIGVTRPETWAKRAVEFADVLGLKQKGSQNRNQHQNQDQYLERSTPPTARARAIGGHEEVTGLARTLRERCQRFKWVV
ncbi:hypothetical protein CLCR_11308 [Cladophialophora carrionii]|uniref:Uncharacterized protein n=1 Tax=Cladophialophora carrionii TaxID=86049 RepID=A0A1C1CJK4_9EURO|nr:hypothetical protein CLCR_11308 [Cladophialophora carrionii]